MIIVGLLLLLAAGGLSLAAIQANRSLFDESAGVVGLFGYSAQATVGEVFLVGAGAGALALLGLMMIFGGMGRRARRSVAARRELRRQEQELRETQRRDETETADRAKVDRTTAREERIAARQERRAAAEEERAAQHRAAEERDDELASR